MANKRFESLDGLKGIAACIIAFAWHYQHFGPVGQNSPLYSIFFASYNYGWLMVEMFFIMSGFGMMVGYKEKIQTHQIEFSDFMRRRMRKIYPLHILTLTLVCVLEFIYKLKNGNTFVYGNYDGYHFLLNVLGIQNGLLTTDFSFNAPTWCVSVLFVQYCLFFYVVSSSNADAAIVCKFMICSILGEIVLITGLKYPLLNEQMARGTACFSIGVILYYIVHMKEKQIGAWAFVFVILTYLAYRIYGDTWIGNIRMTFILGFGPALLLSSLLFKPLRILLSCKFFFGWARYQWEFFSFIFRFNVCLKSLKHILG